MIAAARDDAADLLDAYSPGTGRRYLDFEVFHTTLPVLPASAAAVDVSASAAAGPA